MIVATCRALKYHGGVALKDLEPENLDALRRGLANLDAHVDIIRQFKVPAIVGLNRYPSDTEREYQLVAEHCAKLGVRMHVADIFARGGDGGGDLAKGLRELLASERSDFTPLYSLDQPVKAKLDTIARRIYGADGVVYPPRVDRQIAELETLGDGRLGAHAHPGVAAPRAWGSGGGGGGAGGKRAAGGGGWGGGARTEGGGGGGGAPALLRPAPPFVPPPHPPPPPLRVFERGFRQHQHE